MTWNFVLFLLFFPSAQHAEEFSASYDAEREAILIKGFRKVKEEAIHKNVSVYYGQILAADQPKVIGQFEKVGSHFYFQAKYGFTPGNFYSVWIKILNHKPNSKGSTHLIVKIPSRHFQASTFIKEVYPTSFQIPMNQLKLYLEFSAPMREGKAYEHIKLYRLPEGTLESEAFLAMPEELWDPTGQRLTIFFDPGRIKRGVQPNLQLGLPLVEGRRYKLIIDQDWLDLNGVELIKGFEKEFEVVAVDRTSPDPDSWLIHFPQAGTKNAIFIDFKESMDYGLLHSTLMVKNEDGNKIEGHIELTAGESQWFFYPDNSWKEGEFQIVINSWLEDLAGNNLRRKFDVDLKDPADQPKDIEKIVIPFEINSERGR